MMGRKQMASCLPLAALTAIKQSRAEQKKKGEYFEGKELKKIKISVPNANLYSNTLRCRYNYVMERMRLIRL